MASTVYIDKDSLVSKISQRKKVDIFDVIICVISWHMKMLWSKKVHTVLWINNGLYIDRDSLVSMINEEGVDIIDDMICTIQL